MLDRITADRDTLFDLNPASLLLDDEQEEAARPDDHPTVVAGAAGSGKSRVLAERVVQTLEAAKPSAPAHILVTAFNKGMIEQLAAWVIERAELSSLLAPPIAIHRSEGWWLVSTRASGMPVAVTLVNRDRLPNNVLGLTWPGMARPWSSVVASRRTILEAKHGAARVAEVERFLDPAFLDEELERVVYGTGSLTWEEYRSVRRRGRRKPLRAEIREVVWTALMEPPRPDSFVHRRIAAFEKHRHAIDQEQPLALTSSWTHVFVDECQDFTESDFKLLACIPPDPNHLFVTGDESQSMHLGPCYRRPGLKRRQWKKFELGGSYRLPVRVCEAIEELAAAFVDSHSAAVTDDLDLVLPEARKSAVIGPRPIVVAGDARTLAKDLSQIMAIYRPLFDLGDGVPLVSLAEDEPIAAAALSEAAPWAEHETAGMLRIKGLERSCVVFSDRAELGGDESIPEWVYTALTRSRAVLVIILWPGSPAAVKAVLGRLRGDRLLFWNIEAETLYGRAKELVGSEGDPLRDSAEGD